MSNFILTIDFLFLFFIIFILVNTLLGSCECRALLVFWNHDAFYSLATLTTLPSSTPAPPHLLP